MGSIFVTGFPGFLGSELVSRLLDRTNGPIRCLVQSKYADLARTRAAELSGTDRIELHTGDITDPDLGLGDEYEALQAETTEVFHFAAVYDLGVTREVGMKVNVEGTRNVLDFAAGATSLERFHHVSTCYVSGRHEGVFTHRDLDVGQTFNNYYEETKFLAERAVQDRLADGLPVTIYRPAITVGDSQTGMTQKYDGPYYVLKLLTRQPRVAVLPRFGDPTQFEVNLVPRDFVVDAIDYLSAREESLGAVYQLCDPSPPTVASITRIFGTVLDKRVVSIPSSVALTKLVLDSLPSVEQTLGVEPASLDYFVHPTSYTSENTIRDLSDTDIRCPAFESYVDSLVEFYLTHPNISSNAMV